MHNPMTYILICVITLTIANSMFLMNLEFFGFGLDDDNSVICKFLRYFQEHYIIYYVYLSISIIIFIFGVGISCGYFIEHYSIAEYQVTPFVEITENIEADKPYKYKVTSKEIVETRRRNFWDESWIEGTQRFYDRNLKIIYTDDVSDFAIKNN